MLVVTRPSMRGEGSQNCPPSRGALYLLLLNNTIGVFAQPTLRPDPPHWLHPLPIPNENDTASQKLVLKLYDCLLHILHLLIEVSGDIKASQKSFLIPPIQANHEEHCFTLDAYFAPPPPISTYTSPRVEDALQREVASTLITTRAPLLGGGGGGGPNNSSHAKCKIDNKL